MRKIITVENLDCAVCAQKLEKSISKIDGVKEASINFMSQKLVIELDDGEDYDKVSQKILSAAKKIEPDCFFKGL